MVCFRGSEDIPELLRSLTGSDSLECWRGVIACSTLFEVRPTARGILCRETVPTLTQLCFSGPLKQDQRKICLRLVLRWSSKASPENQAPLMAASLFFQRQRCLLPLPPPAGDCDVPEWEALREALKERGKRPREVSVEREVENSESLALEEALKLQMELVEAEKTVLGSANHLVEVTLGLIMQLEAMIERVSVAGKGEKNSSLGGISASIPGPLSSVSLFLHSNEPSPTDNDEDEFMWGSESDESIVSKEEVVASNERGSVLEGKADEEQWEDFGVGGVSIPIASEGRGVEPSTVDEGGDEGWGTVAGNILVDDICGGEALERLKKEGGESAVELIASLRDSITEVHKVTLPHLQELISRLEPVAGKQCIRRSKKKKVGVLCREDEDSLDERATTLLLYLSQRYLTQLTDAAAAVKGVCRRASLVGIHPSVRVSSPLCHGVKETIIPPPPPPTLTFSEVLKESFMAK